MRARGPLGIGRQLALAALGCAGCNALLGLEDGILVEERCEPFSTVVCYSGPPETQGVGACLTGLRRCNAAGDGYGPCEGEVTPTPERCGNAADDDCDGEVDEVDSNGRGGSAAGGEVCACAPGEVEACPYGGPPGTAGVGACRAGRRTCGADGRWGACAGEVTPRAEDCATPADEDCSGGGDCGAVLPGAPGGGLLGGAGRERARALAAAGDGFAILGGEFEGSLDLGAGPIATGADRDVFIARVGANGAVAWALPLITEGQGSLLGLAVGPEDEVVITGELDGVMSAAGLTTSAPRGFVVKVDASGMVRWGAMLPIGRPQDIAVSAAGDIVVALTVPEPGGGDVAVTRLSATGQPLWTRVFGGPGMQEPTGVAVDARGDVVLTGSFEGEVQFGEEAPRLSSAGMSDVFLAKLDEGGDHVASVAFGDGREQRGGDLEAGPGGELALTGTFEGLLDLGSSTLFSDGVSAFVVELGAGREHRFSRSYRAERPPRVAFAADGGLVLAGDAAGPTDLGGGPLGGDGSGASDIVVARLDAEGRHVWSKRLGPGAGATGGSRTVAGVAAFVERGHVLLAGTVEGSVDLDGAAAQSAASDILLVRLAP